ncbi:MAG TPA: cytochrome b/b6 domain-containing protein [Devosiaceae bacterium]|jgi:thiosulfate reductase cytochrome b subunit
MTAEAADRPVVAEPRAKGPLIYRQALLTRVTHWVWAVTLFFMLVTGLQIFNAYPALHIGQESLFNGENAILQMFAINDNGTYRGQTKIFGHTFDTTGLFGMSGTQEQPQFRGFPAWATVPSYQDLATGRVMHFFFGWILVATMLVWFIGSLINGHIRRDVIPLDRDIKQLPQDIADHARLRFHHTRSYNALQKITYSIVFFILFPLIIATGLTMSPGMDSGFPWLLELFGGRQTARTIHFAVMALLVLFFIVHIVMVLAAGPFNELRSMISGWYRAEPGTPIRPGKEETKR